MAARKNLSHSEIARSRLRATALMNRLQNFALGNKDPRTRKPIEMSQAQVSAALGALRKLIPDLAQVEHSGEIKHHYVAEIPAPSATADEWTQAQAPRLQ